MLRSEIFGFESKLTIYLSNVSIPQVLVRLQRSYNKELNIAPVAQRIEHLTTDQKVRGSNPCGRTNQFERKTELLI
jgi:hypothetical protein